MEKTEIVQAIVRLLKKASVEDLKAIYTYILHLVK